MDQLTLREKALRLHSKNKGKISISSLPIKDMADLTLAYTPGVAEVCKEIANYPDKVFDLTVKSHTVAVVTDGSAVLGLGNIGAEASIPVMEGKCALFKTFGEVDAFPICLKTQDSKEIIEIVKNISPIFGGINLEDISAPRCFEIEEALQNLGIPVMHDDQHGAAIVTLAALINAAKVSGRKLADLKVVVLGAGAAGSGIARLILNKVSDVIVVDSKGIINPATAPDKYKKDLAEKTNKNKLKGSLQDGLKNADVFIGVSKGNLLTEDDIKLMSGKPIIFALANPVPEIMPDTAKKAGAFIVATGRSDFPNQINNSLVFPGVFKGALGVRATKITEQMKVAAAKALAEMVKNPTVNKIIPAAFDKGIADKVAAAVAKAA